MHPCLADIAVDPVANSTQILVVLGVAVGSLIVLFGLVVLVETLVLHLFRWGAPKRAFLDILLVNFVSTLLGALAQPLFLHAGLTLQDMPAAFFLTAFLLSVLIEGGILVMLKRQSAAKTWLAGLCANAASYALLIAIWSVVTLTGWGKPSDYHSIEWYRHQYSHRPGPPAAITMLERQHGKV